MSRLGGYTCPNIKSHYTVTSKAMIRAQQTGAFAPMPVPPVGGNRSVARLLTVSLATLFSYLLCKSI